MFLSIMSSSIIHCEMDPAMARRPLGLEEPFSQVLLALAIRKIPKKGAEHDDYNYYIIMIHYILLV